jgi:hypothetical protein
MTIDEEPLPVMDTGYTFEQLQAMNGMNMTEEDMMAAGMVPDAVANDVATAEPEVRRAEPNMQPTGAFMDLGFIDQINNAATDEEATAMYGSLDPVQKRVYDRSYGINISPEWAAGEASKYYEEQDARAKAAADPRTQALEMQRNEKAQATRDQIGIMRGVVNDILQDPGFSGSVGAKNQAFLFGLKKEPFAGTKEADFMAKLKQLEGGAFLQAFQSLKGGGPITDVEGEKATQAIVRAQTSQSEEGFKKSMNEVLDVLGNAEKRLGGAAQGAAQPAAAPAAAPSGKTAGRGSKYGKALLRRQGAAAHLPRHTLETASRSFLNSNGTTRRRFRLDDGGSGGGRGLVHAGGHAVWRPHATAANARPGRLR